MTAIVAWYAVTVVGAAATVFSGSAKTKTIRTIAQGIRTLAILLLAMQSTL